MVSKKTRDNLIYLAAGFAAVAYALLNVFYIPPERRIDVDWMASFGTTLVLFGYPLYGKKKEELKELRFWVPYLCFLAVHIAFWTYILVTTERVALIVFAIAVFVEEPVLLGALEAAKRKRQQLVVDLATGCSTTSCYNGSALRIKRVTDPGGTPVTTVYIYSGTKVIAEYVGGGRVIVPLIH